MNDDTNEILEMYKESFRPRWQDYEEEYDFAREKQIQTRGKDFPVYKMLAVLFGMLIWCGVIVLVANWIGG